MFIANLFEVREAATDLAVRLATYRRNSTVTYGDLFALDLAFTIAPTTLRTSYASLRLDATKPAFD